MASEESKSSRDKPVGTHYGQYLKLDQLLSAQSPRSHQAGHPAHDEMLFVIIHQTYELWFKQIIHELGSVRPLFADTTLDEKNMGVIVARLARIIEIQRILVDQLNILETMTPLDFLDFRDYLVPASGFQSVQFRLIEATLGLRHEDRTAFSQDAYRTSLTQEERDLLSAAEKGQSLWELLQAWLERIPFLDTPGYNFWDEYIRAADKMLESDAQIIRTSTILSERDKENQLAQLASTRLGFERLANEETYDEQASDGQRRLSYRAISAAVFIELYRDFPALQLPHTLLRQLVDIDELFTNWRHRHAMMVHRMIGRKIGTGGSSGHKYLRSAADKHRVFMDLFDLPTFLIPRSALPTLPAELERRLRFAYEDKL